MIAKRLSMLFLAMLLLGAIACYRPYGYHFYPDAPHFAPTSPPAVDLLRREPRRDHIRLGEVWIRPSPRWDRYFREGVVYTYWHGPRVVYDRQIVGIAIRYRR